MNRRLIGESGEELAANWLIAHRYRILARNYRALTGEIDIIAADRNKTVVFVEVKRRLSALYGRPAEAVTRAKQQKIARTAVCYLKENKLTDRAFRFDVIELFDTEIEHISSAFESDILF